MESIGQQLTNLRKQAGLSQKEFAQMLGCDNSSLSKIENDIRIPTPAMLNKMQRILSRYSDDISHEYSKVIDAIQNNLNRQSVSLDKRPHNDNRLTSEFMEFSTISAASSLLIEIARKESETLNLKVIAATGGTTLSSILPTVIKSTLAKQINITLYVISKDSPFVKFFPQHWPDEVQMVLNRLKKGFLPSTQAHVSLSIFSYDFMPILHGIMINKQHLLIGFFGWNHFSGKLELSGAENPHRYYSKELFPNAEYYFHIFEDWTSNMPCTELYPHPEKSSLNTSTVPSLDD